MRSAVVAAFVLFSSFALGQNSTPSVDIFGGYSYVNVDTNGLTSRQSANGWEAAVSVNFSSYVAAEGDFTGYYKNNILGSGVNLSDWGVVGGPRFNYGYVFLHALFGPDVLTGSTMGVSLSQTSFVAILGGGVQYPFAPHWAVRASADAALTHHNILLGPRVQQNNFRVSGGIVFTFGGRAQTGAALPHEQHTCGVNSATAHPVTLAELGLSGDSSSIYGFHITAVARGSASDGAGLAINDYIVSVNCVEVHNADDLVAALSHAKGVALVAVSKPSWLASQTEVRRLEVGGRP